MTALEMNTHGLVEHPDPAPYPFGPTSVAEVLGAGLAEHPERVALIDGDRTWTWSQLDDAVAAVAGGIAPDDQMWWSLGNSAESVIGMLATFRAGATWVGLSEKEPRRRRADLERWIGPVRLIETVADVPHGARERRPIDPSAPALVTFTSGTTGRPKAVVHSQRNMLWPGLISAELEPPQPGERIGTPLSLGIANIVALGPISAFLRGTTYVVMGRTSASGFAEDIELHAVTRTFLVATILHDLVAADDLDPASLASLDRVVAGGSGANPALLANFFDRFGVRPTLSYGLSEAPTGVVRESLHDPIGSGRGFPLPHVEVTILAPDDTPVSQGVTGEICISPATTGAWANTWTPTLGYVGEPGRTAALFRTGRLHTGDLGRLDRDGALTITGRMSDLIIRGGKNIDPSEVEEALRRHPGVSDALVYGEPDERLGQRVVAKVVPSDVVDRDDPLGSSHRLQVHVRATVDQHLDSVEIVAELPRNEMGKLIRGG